jgi:hypothetical protein
MWSLVQGTSIGRLRPADRPNRHDAPPSASSIAPQPRAECQARGTFEDLCAKLLLARGDRSVRGRARRPQRTELAWRSFSASGRPSISTCISTCWLSTPCMSRATGGTVSCHETVPPTDEEIGVSPSARYWTVYCRGTRYRYPVPRIVSTHAASAPSLRRSDRTTTSTTLLAVGFLYPHTASMRS